MMNSSEETERTIAKILQLAEEIDCMRGKAGETWVKVPQWVCQLFFDGDGNPLA